MDARLVTQLAEARAARAELARVTERLAQARRDHARLVEHAGAMAAVLESEQADVARLQGVGGFFRKLVAGGDLALEQQELAAAKLQHAALLDELRATDADIAQLERRFAAASAGAATYAPLLAEAERALLASGSPHGAALAKLAEADANARIARREIAEAIAAGYAAQEAFVEAQAIAAKLGTARDDDDGPGLPAFAMRGELSAALARAQHALELFQRECRDVGPVVEGIEVSPLPAMNLLLATDFLFATAHHADSAAAQIELLSSYVVSTVLELRGREQELQQSEARVMEQRAAILDPPA